MTVRLIHDDAIGLVTGVDPDHGHGIKSQVDKVMAEALWYECRRITRKLVAPAFDDAGGCSLNDGDRLIEFMAMAGKPGTGVEQAVAAADALGRSSPLNRSWNRARGASSNRAAGSLRQSRSAPGWPVEAATLLDRG